MALCQTLWRVSFGLLFVFAFLPVLFHFWSLRFQNNQQLIEREEPTQKNSVDIGFYALCSFRNLELKGKSTHQHLIWKNKNVNRCPLVVDEYIEASAVASLGGDVMRLEHDPVFILLNSCVSALHESYSLEYIYQFFDAMFLCAKRLQEKDPTAILAWLPSDWPNIPVDVEQLRSHLIFRHVVESCGILLLQATKSSTATDERRDDHIKEQQKWHMRYFVRHLQSPLPVVAASIAAFQHQQVAQYTPGSLSRRCKLLLYTRKYDAHCHPAGALAYPLLITGLGGAGTHFIAQRLASEGWRMKHEEVDLDGSVSWFYAANDNAIGLPYPYGALSERGSGVLYPRFSHVVHLVRDPEAQISSFTAHSNKTYNFLLKTMQAVLPLLSEQEQGRGKWSQESEDAATVVRQFEQARDAQNTCFRGERCHLSFAALAWLHWNRFVHSYADATFRVDQEEEIVAHVCEIVGGGGSVGNSDALQDQPTSAMLRLCDVPSCPSVRTSSKGWRHTALRLADSLFGVCHINEALFQRSAVHKRHLKYTLQDIANIDPRLAQSITAMARAFGFCQEKVGT